jgi:hypothetical protein
MHSGIFCHKRPAFRWPVSVAFLFGLVSFASGEEMDHAQMNHSKMDHSMMEGMKMPMAQPAKSSNPRPSKKQKRAPVSAAMPMMSGHMDHDHTTHDISGHDMATHGMSGHTMTMTGFLGPYGMTREGSGTSWQPDTSPHEGIHQQLEEWSVMTHGSINLNYDQQAGSRGGDKTFVSGMLMTMAQRPLGEGTFGLRAMMSPEPAMGPAGYPLLLATGETSDGKTALVDRQHPHDLFMELASIYSTNLSSTSSLFVYGGLPGEPALGPPAFMHRTSGMDNPEAPISHHWLDSTHITFGVVTGGLVLNDWKFEASSFRGREPDQYRYDIEKPSLDSFAGRVSWNPSREWSLQVSYGHLHSPEQLTPEINENRLTASAIYTTPFGDGHLWSTTAAWGRKVLQSSAALPSAGMLPSGGALDAYLLESSAILKNNVTLFMRAERVAENELTDDIPGLAGKVFTVNKVSAGGIYDFWRNEHAKMGLGGLVSRYGLPDALKTLYGRDLTSFMIFGRLKLI